MQLTDHFQDFAPPLLFSFAQQARTLAADGVHLVSMEQGQMDFPTPENVIAAANAFISTGQVLYTNVDGIPDLKAAIRAKFQQNNDLVFSDDEIFVGAGTSQVIYNAFAVTLSDGDEVIIPTPAWTVFSLGVTANGGKVVEVATSQEDRFKLTPECLAGAIGDRTRWLILNSPSNPTGALYSREELKGLAVVLDRHPHVSIMSDDLYEHQVFDGARFCNILNVAPHLRDRVIVINGVAKTFGMTGWRIGYGAGPSHLLTAMKWYQAPASSSPCHVSQVAAIEALNGPQDYLRDRLRLLQKRRDILVAGLNQVRGWSALSSEGAFYVYASCAGLIGARAPGGHTLEDDVAIAKYLLEQAHVVTVPGTAFGLSPFIRFSFGTSTDRVSEAVDRIRTATSQLEGIRA